ncbi:MAG: glycosyl hydrolase [Rhizobacter sp.]
MNASIPPSSTPAPGPAAPADVSSSPSTDSVLSRRRVLALAASFPLAACGGSDGGSPATGAPPPPAAGTPAPPAGAPAPTPTPTPPATKSAKRGIAYDLRDAADLAALAPGVSWWYNWSPRTTVSPETALANAMDFQPMLWNGVFDDAAIEAELKARPAVKYLLLLNEPNLNDQAVMSPAEAAALWPRYEALATRTGVQLVGPAMTWGTLAGFADPVVWLDAFYAAYRSGNGNRDPRIDHLAFHWYDYGLDDQLDRLLKFGKPFWVTEFANWHSQADGAQIDSIAKQKAQMTEMVATCERRTDVVRYAWFTGRWPDDPHYTSLLGARGELTELGRHYLSLPYGS